MRKIKLTILVLTVFLMGMSFSSCEKETVYYVVEKDVESSSYDSEGENGDNYDNNDGEDEDNSISYATGTINGYGYVDLGLRVKWAICNVGAYNPFGYGNYYAWGETKPKSEYTNANCATKDLYLGSIAGNASYDAARANWGDTWRMPTEDELSELQEECKWELVTINGHYGHKGTGPNGNSVFFPAAGYYDTWGLDYIENMGLYWTATPSYYTSGYYGAVAIALLNRTSYPIISHTSRHRGYTVRAVSE